MDTSHTHYWFNRPMPGSNSVLFWCGCGARVVMEATGRRAIAVHLVAGGDGSFTPQDWRCIGGAFLRRATVGGSGHYTR